MLGIINSPNYNKKFVERKDLKNYYKYPNKLDFHPDSAFHKKILDLILGMAWESSNVMRKRYPQWRELDQKLTVYIDLDSKEKAIKAKDSRKPVSLVIPMSYATREAYLTYYTAAFFRNPLFEYAPSQDPEDLIKVMMLQSLIANQCVKSKVALSEYTMWGDAITYGFGAVGTTYKKEVGFQTRKKLIFEESLGLPPSDRYGEVREKVTLFEGNALETIDPYNSYPDPNFPITEVQRSGYFGWVERTNYNKLLEQEAIPENQLFNIKYLETLKGRKDSQFHHNNYDNTGRYNKTQIGAEQKSAFSFADPVDVLHFYARIVPTAYDLDKTDFPEIWKFAVTADRIVIEARPVNLNHNQIPVAVASPESDGHSTLPVSVLEREYPIQHAVDWLWRAHQANVRKAVNNMFVIDPMIVDENDFIETEFGMVARLRETAWGKNVKDGVMQLPVQDVTRGHISDIGFLMGIDNVVFASPQAKGYQERRGERVSASEAQDTRTSFLSKMEKGAKLIAMQAHYDIAFQFAHNVAQLMQEEQYVKLVGRYDQILMERYGIKADTFKVSPSALDVNFDVLVQDGTIPNGDTASTWQQLLAVGMQNPEIYQRVDFVRVWSHIAEMLGAKNPEQFLKAIPESTIVSDEQAQAEAQKGNLEPVRV